MLPVDTVDPARPAVQAVRLCDLEPQDMAVCELTSNQRKAKHQSNRWKTRHTWKKGREPNPGERIRLAKEWEEEAELESESPAVGSQILRQLKYVPTMCLWCGGLLILCESIYAMMVVFAPLVVPEAPTDQPPTQSSSLSDSSPPHGLAHLVPIASESSFASPPPPRLPLLRPHPPLSPPLPISPPSSPPLPAGAPRCQKPTPPPRPASPPPPHPSPPSTPASLLQNMAALPSHPPPPHVPMSYFCPKGYHLCNPNQRQPLHFCDVDVDCWGDVDYCHTFNSVCREQRGCCVVPAVRSFLPPSPPPLPPAPPAPLVPVCPEHTHLCAPNGRQKGIFCDVDRDCYGDVDYCHASPACPAKKGCCIQRPKVEPMPKGWLPPLSGDPQLSPAVCERLLRDPGHLFRRMWGVHSRHQNHKGDDACWSRARDADWVSQLPEQYFEDIFSGRYCQLTDWYDGSPFAHGVFSRAAPALLGFDADILGFCNGNCDGANANILALFGNHVKYNTCRNLEWQMCAVRGMLDWQDSKEIMFARAPKTVSMDGAPPFGHCSGYTDAPCNDWEGFANDDIFYLEVCLFSMLCKNSDELFRLNVGERFICDFSEEGFSLLQQLLLEGPES